MHLKVDDLSIRNMLQTTEKLLNNQRIALLKKEIEKQKKVLNTVNSVHHRSEKRVQNVFGIFKPTQNKLKREIVKYKRKRR